MLPSVNFHFWEPCNMRCGFCFATFQDVKHTILPKGHLNKEQAIHVIDQLSNVGFEKITFAGGEPTLCPWLHELIGEAKLRGMTTMIVTNGSNLSEDFLKTNQGHLDWVALSVDSISETSNISSGRAYLGKKSISGEQYYRLVDSIKSEGYGLKINTVVHAKNWEESLEPFIRYATPLRWKVLKVLPIVGQNDKHFDGFSIEDWQFREYLQRHEQLKSLTHIIPEFNDNMTGSYAMVDPAGRFTIIQWECISIADPFWKSAPPKRYLKFLIALKNSKPGRGFMTGVGPRPAIPELVINPECGCQRVEQLANKKHG